MSCSCSSLHEDGSPTILPKQICFQISFTLSFATTHVFSFDSSSAVTEMFHFTTFFTCSLKSAHLLISTQLSTWSPPTDFTLFTLYVSPFYVLFLNALVSCRCSPPCPLLPPLQHFGYHRRLSLIKQIKRLEPL